GGGGGYGYLLIIMIVTLFVFIEWLGRDSEFAIQKLWLRKNRWVRYFFYYSIVLAIFMFAGKEQEFIYFQF
ncbi:MBOAT family protein, partial [Capnocytophaga stomatis]